MYIQHTIFFIQVLVYYIAKTFSLGNRDNKTIFCSSLFYNAFTFVNMCFQYFVNVWLLRVLILVNLSHNISLMYYPNFSTYPLQKCSIYYINAENILLKCFTRAVELPHDNANAVYAAKKLLLMLPQSCMDIHANILHTYCNHAVFTLK